MCHDMKFLSGEPRIIKWKESQLALGNNDRREDEQATKYDWSHYIPGLSGKKAHRATKKTG